MTKTKNISIFSAGIVVLLVTIAVFFMSDWNNDGSTIDLISFLFVLFSEAAFFCSLSLMAEMPSTIHNKTFVWSGIVTSLAGYGLCMMIMTFIRKNYYDDVTKYLMHQVILLAIITIILITIYFVAMHINESDDHIGRNRAYMQDVESKLLILKTDSKNEKYAAQLDELYEIVKCSDKSNYCPLDDKISIEMDNLVSTFNATDEKYEENIQSSIQSLETLFKRRNIELAEDNRGRF